jgi:hypothetical protein
MRRDIGVTKVETLLLAIIRRKKLSGEKAIAFTRDLADRHERWCKSEQWREEGGRYAKSLENWLAPTKERYEADPPMDVGSDANNGYYEVPEL